MATITKRGDTWQAKVRRKGYPAQSATFRTKAAADRWAREVEGKVDNGTFSPLDSDARRITLSEAIDRYMSEFTATKRGGNRERARLERWKRHDLAPRVLAAIRPHDMAQARNSMAARGLGPNSIRLELAPISHLYTIARKEWGLAGLVNPVQEITKPSTAGTERNRRLEDGEEARILDAALRWDWIDFKRSTLRLPMTKNGEARTVPLSPLALETLQAMPRNLDGRVLGTNPDEISHQFAAACAGAGVAGLHFHDLRHEAVSRLFERGDLNLVEVASISGHRTLSQLKRYTHPRAEDIAAKMAKKTPHKAG